MIVDTNALSAWRDDNDEALTRLLRNAETLVIPVIVIGEYRYGIVRLKRRRDAETWLRRILQSYRIASVGLATANIYARERARLREIGRPIPENDLWIAAIALEHGMPVLSRDADFDSVEGLTRVSW